MKARTLILSAILLPIAAAQVSNTDALNDLRKTHPTVKWRTQPLAVADVLCEGKPGTVILGSEKDDVVVGVVSGLREHKTEVLSFPIRSGTQNGFCVCRYQHWRTARVATRAQGISSLIQEDYRPLPGPRSREPSHFSNSFPKTFRAHFGTARASFMSSPA